MSRIPGANPKSANGFDRNRARRTACLPRWASGGQPATWLRRPLPASASGKFNVVLQKQPSHRAKAALLHAESCPFTRRKDCFDKSTAALLENRRSSVVQSLNSIYFTGTSLYLWCRGLFFTELIHKFALSNGCGSWISPLVNRRTLGGCM